MANYKEVIKKNLKGFSDYVALATVSPKSYREVNLEIIRFLTESNMPGVYVTLNAPYATIKKRLEDNGIDTRLIIFIDAVTKTSQGIEREENCLFIGNPQNLSDISVAMDQAVRSLPTSKRFLFFDSLSTLLLYNNATSVAQFVHFLSGRMHVWKVNGIIISLQSKKDKELIDSLLPFCDTQINLED